MSFHFGLWFFFFPVQHQQDAWQGSLNACSSTILCCDPLIQPLTLWGPPTVELLSLLLHNRNFSTVVNPNANMCYAGYPICAPWKGLDPQVENL